MRILSWHNSQAFTSEELAAPSSPDTWSILPCLSNDRLSASVASFANPVTGKLA